MKFIARHVYGASFLTLCFAASVAHAGTTAAPIHNSSSYQLFGFNGPPSKSGNPGDANINYASAEGLYSGITLQGLSQLDTESILFKNGVVVAGRSAFAEMKTGVAITFTNTNATRVVRPVVTSTLLAAGLGLYVTNELRSPFDIVPPGTCSTAALLNCGVSTSGTYYGASHWANSWASFEFDVSVGGTSVYSLNGKVGTDASGNFYEDMAAARATLGGFTEIADPANPLARGYKWDDTAVKIALLDPLNPGESVTAIYSIRTAVKIGDTNYGLTYQTNPYYLSESQIAYSSFGDPTGGKTPISTSATAALLGAGVNNIGTPGPVLDLSGVGRFSLPGSTIETDPVTNQPILVSNPVEKYNPVTKEYELIAKVTGKTITPAVGGVPEPASWAMLIAGFGLTGAAMRRRRSATAA